jgi:UDP-2,3-diacylglucosamine pyrophosphatase LpxH
MKKVLSYMVHDRAITNRTLSQLWRSEDIPALATRGKKYAIISDIHLGDGGGADDFRHNVKTLTNTLNHYNKNGYNLILLGDIEEFWQFDLEKIVNQYKGTVYKAIKAFGDERVYRVFGNHDLEWHSLPDPIRKHPARYNTATEALKIKDKEGRIRMLLVHGHQVDTGVDKQIWSNRFLGRLYKKIEPYVKIDRPTSATQSQITKNYERIMYTWAKSEKIILICGHSHRAIFASKSYIERLREHIAELEADIAAHPADAKLLQRNRRKIMKLRSEERQEKRRKRDISPTESRGKPLPCYFNTGCALYTDGITVIEIAHDAIKLVKWHRDSTKRHPFEVYERGRLSTYIKETNDGAEFRRQKRGNRA